ncbi:MAG: hypothetical protein ABI606_12895 [Rhodoferax sp.]
MNAAKAGARPCMVNTQNRPSQGAHHRLLTGRHFFDSLSTASDTDWKEADSKIGAVGSNDVPKAGFSQ